VVISRSRERGGEGLVGKRHFVEKTTGGLGDVSHGDGGDRFGWGEKGRVNCGEREEGLCKKKPSLLKPGRNLPESLKRT